MSIPPALSLASKVEPNPEAVWQEVDGRVVFLQLVSSQYFELDGVGARMWTELLAVKELGAAKDHLLEVFEADATTLERDLLELVGKLVDADLLQLTA